MRPFCWFLFLAITACGCGAPDTETNADPRFETDPFFRPAQPAEIVTAERDTGTRTLEIPVPTLEGSYFRSIALVGGGGDPLGLLYSEVDPTLRVLSEPAAGPIKFARWDENTGHFSTPVVVVPNTSLGNIEPFTATFDPESRRFVVAYKSNVDDGRLRVSSSSDGANWTQTATSLDGCTQMRMVARGGVYHLACTRGLTHFYVTGGDGTAFLEQQVDPNSGGYGSSSVILTSAGKPIVFVSGQGGSGCLLSAWSPGENARAIAGSKCGGTTGDTEARSTNGTLSVAYWSPDPSGDDINGLTVFGPTEVPTYFPGFFLNQFALVKDSTGLDVVLGQRFDEGSLVVFRAETAGQWRSTLLNGSGINTATGLALDSQGNPLVVFKTTATFSLGEGIGLWRP